MRIPVDIPHKPGTIWRLLKTLYCLKQSGHVWNNLLVKALREFGFEQCPDEPCLFIVRRNDQFVMIAIHVDDLGGITSDQQLLEDVIAHLSSHFDTKHLGPLEHYLNILISR